MASPAQRPCCDVSRELMHTIAREDWTEVKNILSESSRHVADSIVTQLINKDQWGAVMQIIKCVGGEDRTWNIDGIVVKSSILLSIANRYWTYLNESPSERFTDTMFQWIIRQVCTRATEREVFQFVLVYCADDRLDFVLTILVERRQWKAVGQVLVRGVSDSMNQWAVRETCKHCKNKDFGTFDFRSSVSYLRWNQRDHVTVEHFLIRDILPHCAKDQLNSVLTTLVERRLWLAVGGMLRKGVSDSNKQWAVQEACKHCEGYEVESLIQNILPHCADDQLDSVLTTLVERRQWRAVGGMLKKGVSDSNKQWAVQQACKHCKGYGLKSLIQNILPHCADDQLDSVLTTLVERRLWHAVLYVLEHGVSDSSKRWVVLEVCACCEFVSQEQKLSDILLFCADDQVDCVLTILVERRLWRAVEVILKKKGVSDSYKQSAVQEACKHCKDYELESLIQNILPHCADDQLDSVLTTLVERSLWQAVGVVLKKKGVSDSNKQWAVLEACKHCEGYGLESLIQNILPHCADDQLDIVLITLVERRQWLAVLYVLERGVSDSHKQWAVQEACKHCEGYGLESLIQNILPHCADDQLDSVLITLVERRQWLAVLYVLERSVSDSNKQWAVQEACKHCNGYQLESLIQNILPHCADDQLDSVLTTLVERRLWQIVLYVLKRGVSDSSKRRVVLEVCICESRVQVQVLSDILPFCADDQVECLLTTLVERLQRTTGGEMLKLVVELLKQCVSETLDTRLVEEARKRAKNDGFVKYVLPHCSLSHLNSAMPNLVKQGEHTAVHTVMHRLHIDMYTKSFVLPRWFVDVLPMFAELSLWSFVQEILHSVVMKSLYHWVTQEEEIKKDDSVLWAIVNSCRVNATCAVQLFKEVKEDTERKVRELQMYLGLTGDLCELLYTSFLDQVCVALCSEGEITQIMTDSLNSHLYDIYTEIIFCIQTISANSVERMIGHFQSDALKITTSGKLSSSSVHHFLHLLKQFNLYYTSKRRVDDDELLLMMFAVLPLSPGLQSVALRIMLRHKRWDVISQADLSGVWEQDRRHLLQAAVKQRQWSVVKRWADHTLYDDQRVWALNEALNEKQWDVALLLADHGLTDIDLMRVHYRLAKYADWDVILHMFERGADVAEVKERLRRMKDNKRIPKNVIRCIEDRCSQVEDVEKDIQMAKSDGLETACRSCNWIFVLFTLIRNPGKVSVHCALKVAIQKKAWHVVMQLVRLGIDAEQRHSLFSWMMKRRQWGVCRVLLEQGLSVQLCLEVLPKLMEMNQWALVARVMEHDVGDDARQQVMQRAWERREGGVVWLCIKSLPIPLSVEERESLFQRAFSCEMWQVIKPLVEEKDETGIRHRDTALLEAIDLHEWDLVDHCQRYHADINMKDDDGHTPLQRAAMKKDWEAVEELVVRDGDPNLLDREGYTVLHRAIDAQQIGIVHLLIQYHADIHKGEKSWYGGKGVTPLNMLIDTKQGDVIERTLFWCPDQSKGVNDAGETTLHAACLSGCYDSMYYLVARGVNPLAVTKTGQSVLVYAVLNENRPQKMVAECIRLGYSTHQPKLTNIASDLKSLVPFYRLERNIWLPGRAITSPFLCALLLGLPVVMKMLYDSGAVSQGELFSMYADLPKLAEPTSSDGTKVHELAAHCFDTYKKLNHCIMFAAPCLIEIATTPRSLVSTCRLVISHCLTLSKTRHRDVDQLPLTERMKNFVLFSDLTDPDFGKDTT